MTKRFAKKSENKGMLIFWNPDFTWILNSILLLFESS